MCVSLTCSAALKSSLLSDHRHPSVLATTVAARDLLYSSASSPNDAGGGGGGRGAGMPLGGWVVVGVFWSVGRVVSGVQSYVCTSSGGVLWVCVAHAHTHIHTQASETAPNAVHSEATLCH